MNPVIYHRIADGEFTTTPNAPDTRFTSTHTHRVPHDEVQEIVRSMFDHMEDIVAIEDCMYWVDPLYPDRRYSQEGPYRRQYHFLTPLIEDIEVYMADSDNESLGSTDSEMEDAFDEIYIED